MFRTVPNARNFPPATRSPQRLVAVVAFGAICSTGCTSGERDFGGAHQMRDAAASDAGGATTVGSESEGTDTAASKSEGASTATHSAGSTATTASMAASSDVSEQATSDEATQTSPEATWATDPAESGTGESSSTSGETNPGDDFGVGTPPDLGSIGAGDGRLLIVNAFEKGAVDVWVAGARSPLAEGLAAESAVRQALPTGARRVVFTRPGTRDVVGCSEWFALRNGEQWAVVPFGGEHTCRGEGDGETNAFKQEQPLDENPVRYVHATAPDRFSVTRNDQAEPGVLEQGETLRGTALPSCSSGCAVRYRIAAEGVPTARYVSLQVTKAEQLPPAGEVLLLVLGNVRQDWPAEKDALRLLRVDLDGTTYVLRRDPEIAFARIGGGRAAIRIPTPPSSSEILTVDSDCAEPQCPLPTVNWAPGRQTFYVEADEGSSELAVEFPAGHRYVLLSTADAKFPLYWLGADFDRGDANGAFARGINLDPLGDDITFGYVFGQDAVEIDGLTAIAPGAISEDENGGLVPAEENWRLVTAVGGDVLGTGCFFSMDTVAGYRGYFVVTEGLDTLDVTTWPPASRPSYMVCF